MICTEGFAKNMKIYLLAIDLDGTLLNSGKDISPTTEGILRSARREHGVKVVLATARPPRTVLPFHRRLNLDTPLICYNGALVFDPLLADLPLLGRLDPRAEDNQADQAPEQNRGDYQQKNHRFFLSFGSLTLR